MTREKWMKKLTQDEREKIIELYKDDKSNSYRKLAKQFGVSHQRVNQIIKENEIVHQ